MKEIRIEGEISSWTRYDVNWQLRQAKGQPVTIKVASYGGDIAAAVAISHAIRDHGDVTVIHDSLNASAATWLPFGAKKIKMHEDCMLYVHCSSQEVFMWSQMNAEQLKELEMDIESDVRTLETMDRMIANKYARRTAGKYTQEQMLRLMNEHPWLTAQQCLEYGFIDEIIEEPAVEGKKLSNTLAKQFKNCAIPLPEGIEVEKSLLQRIAEKLGITSTTEGRESLPLSSPATVKGASAPPSSPGPAAPATVKGASAPPSSPGPSAPAAAPPSSLHPSSITHHPSNNMNKTFTTVNALLKVEGIEQSADNKLVLTEEQLQTIEDKLKTLDNMSAQLATANEAKKTAEDSLKAASDSLDALSDDIKAIDGIDNKCAKIKEMFDKVPAVQVPTPAGEQTDVYADIRKDPVNFYDQE